MNTSTSGESATNAVNFFGPTIALHRPQIPQNTGNISRLCVALNSPLIITGKAGFSFDEAAVRRAGLDHWEHLRFQHYARFKDFCKANPTRRIVGVTKAGKESALNFKFQSNDILLFGNETAGLPPKLLNSLHFQIHLPMFGPVRSLNLSNAVAVVAYAYVKSLGPSAAYDPADYPRTYFKRAP